MTAFTNTSPTSGGAVPTGVTEIGGLVLDLIGANGARVVSELPASQLFVGYSNAGTPAGFQGNPVTIGIQTGFTPAVIAALGGGIAEAAVRVTLFDGDTASGNFDFNDNTLRLNDITVGNFSAVQTERTSSNGQVASFSELGFQNEELNTGWFKITGAATLSSLYTSLSSGQVKFALNDVDPTDNFYDFTQGIDGGLVNVGQPPVVTPPSTLPDCDVVQRANSVDGSDPANQTLTGVVGPNTFFFHTGGTTGKDTITNFEKVDVLVTDHKLFDGNNDGIITFGKNGVLNLDGPDSGDSVKLMGINPAKGLRYLGTDDNDCFVYADATVRPKGAVEGTVANDALLGDLPDVKKQVFFFDTALKIGLGNDTITNFGAKDLLVTTTKILDKNGDGKVDFGGDKILDLPNATGKVTIDNKATTILEFDGSTVHNGVEYFVYSKVGSAAGVADLVFAA